jgi:hypothetical protein
LKQPEVISLLSSYGIQISKEDNMQQQVTQYLQYLLENDMSKLYALLYRIDINENKAKQAFGGGTPEIASKLCDLIVERLNQKIISRNKYKPK